MRTGDADGPASLEAIEPRVGIAPALVLQEPCVDVASGQDESPTRWRMRPASKSSAHMSLDSNSTQAFLDVNAGDCASDDGTYPRSASCGSVSEALRIDLESRSTRPVKPNGEPRLGVRLRSLAMIQQATGQRLHFSAPCSPSIGISTSQGMMEELFSASTASSSGGGFLAASLESKLETLSEVNPHYVRSSPYLDYNFMPKVAQEPSMASRASASKEASPPSTETRSREKSTSLVDTLQQYHGPKRRRSFSKVDTEEEEFMEQMECGSPRRRGNHVRSPCSPRATEATHSELLREQHKGLESLRVLTNNLNATLSRHAAKFPGGLPGSPQRHPDRNGFRSSNTEQSSSDRKRPSLMPPSRPRRASAPNARPRRCSFEDARQLSWQELLAEKDIDIQQALLSDGISESESSSALSSAFSDEDVEETSFTCRSAGHQVGRLLSPQGSARSANIRRRSTSSEPLGKGGSRATSLHSSSRRHSEESVEPWFFSSNLECPNYKRILLEGSKMKRTHSQRTSTLDKLDSASGKELKLLTHYSDPTETVIFFDWDDTLCPSTWILDDTGLPWDKPAPCFEDPSVPLYRKDSEGNGPTSSGKMVDALKEHASMVATLLLQAAQLGTVVILTLGGVGWVDLSIRHFLPWLEGFMEANDIQVVYAREALSREEIQRTVQDGVDGFALQKLLKRLSMSQMTHEFYDRKPYTSFKNVLSIGDSEVERDALWALMEEHRDLQTQLRRRGLRSRSKTLKLQDAPGLEQMALELRIISAWLVPLVFYDGDFKADLGEPSHAVATAHDHLFEHFTALTKERPQRAPSRLGSLGGENAS
eukprot:TRINITY_DN111344_c0_g1_i1.p1 TRINITY_DN111344_c0_g1~~TRINITY_DN111344_c0_g1_i1.p1  ORF type:complete len:823 (+),score=155.70 TRINITY_DN111344_c0_g1_i1:175-2643(+)